MAEVGWTRETDVVVIGGGLAGYCAAIEAAQATIMAAMRAQLEKQARLGRSDVDSLVGEVAQSISLRLSQVLRRDELG